MIERFVLKTEGKDINSVSRYLPQQEENYIKKNSVALQNSLSVEPFFNVAETEEVGVARVLLRQRDYYLNALHMYQDTLPRVELVPEHRKLSLKFMERRIVRVVFCAGWLLVVERGCQRGSVKTSMVRAIQNVRAFCNVGLDSFG